ncbi:hypothetical protein PG996_005119 [Apiospora saccharicola]|uniref:Uncharacterized protein n=1 Tax=Apiospora saccharicola TaxID=335842 RepID=A0ABR1VKK7_9PEZI
MKTKHRARMTGRIAPKPNILSRNRGGKAGNNRGGGQCGTPGGTRRGKQPLSTPKDEPNEQDPKEELNEQESESEDQEVEMPSTSTGPTIPRAGRMATKMRAIPVPAIVETLALPQQKRGTKRGASESEVKAESDDEDNQPAPKAPRRGETAELSKPQMEQADDKKKAVSSETSGAKKASDSEESTMKQHVQHAHRTRGNTHSHQAGPSVLAALAAGHVSKGSVWPGAHQESGQQEARQRAIAARRKGGVPPPKEDEQLDDDEDE